MKTCRDVCLLLSSDTLEYQGRRVRWAVALHLRLCRYCARLARQLRQIRYISRKWDDEVPPDLEAKIVRRLSGPSEQRR